MRKGPTLRPARRSGSELPFRNPAGEGTGPGLSMTHDIIVKQHGGRIDVETRLGVFTEFMITFPRDAAVTLQTASRK